MPNEVIREEIAKKGILPFSRFMELALYCPESGYYETDRGKVGRGGDFITSVSVGNLFGQLLAFQFAAWLEALPSSSKTLIIEAGAHDGRLAHDILAWLQNHRPTLFGSLEYWILEPSPNRRQWQQETLKEFTPLLHWISKMSQLSPPDSLAGDDAGITGVIFGNELLDAFPVQRFGWDKSRGQWFEWGISLAADKLVWDKLPGTKFSTGMPELESVLPDDYSIEISPAAKAWWREAAGSLKQGRLLTIDYGFVGEERFLPSRQKGTLRAYFQHHVTDDILANPGEQDLTAHVDFSAIQKAGESVGLRTESFSTQAQFLTQILSNAQSDPAFAVWDSRRARQFQTLTHPEHFGRAFRVLVQGR